MRGERVQRVQGGEGAGAAGAQGRDRGIEPGPLLQESVSFTTSYAQPLLIFNLSAVVHVSVLLKGLEHHFDFFKEIFIRFIYMWYFFIRNS